MAAISALMISDTPLRKEPFEEERSPTTPRGPAPVLAASLPAEDHANESTNTNNQSGGVEMSQSPTMASATALHTQTSTQRASPDDAMDSMDIDGEQDDQDGSDNDTEQGEGGGSRKKKGQRFFCTGYPPCNLSFTRSEHLARHIRKHTGERPFQCHCNRRFSRLDNLRQHAQTVHVNEEIPTDSLAATGTRFQRQIRTDRVRPAGRPRSGTMSSTGTHSRGHSRNLSASSIGSTSSNYSTSTVDPRRRPPPLLMADGRPKLGIETPSTPPPQFATFSTHSPGDVSTPTSTAYSVTPSSPIFGSTVGSPLASAPRGGSFSGSRTPVRRLSVPSGPNPYHSPYPPPYPLFNGHQSGPQSTVTSVNPSTITSPTNSTFSHPPAFGAPPGDDWRRRTWHPSTYSGLNFNYPRPATSGLTYSQTPDAPQPAFAQNATAAAGQAPRLPGIESFDHVQQRPTTPPRHNSLTGNQESSSQPSLMPPVEFESHSFGHRRHVSADIPRQNRYADMDDRMQPNRGAGFWVQDTIDQMHNFNSIASKRKTDAPHHPMAPPPTTAAAQQPPSTYETIPPPFIRGRDNRGSAASAARTSPEDSGSSDGVPTPGTSVSDIHPTIVPSTGILETQHAGLPLDSTPNQCLHPPQPLPTPHDESRFYDRPRAFQYSSQDQRRSELNRLDALVAVATSEKNSTTAAQ